MRRSNHAEEGGANDPRGNTISLDTMRAKGRRALQGGVYNGVAFAYLSTDEDLGVVTEIFDWPPGRVQEPDAVYP
jgi:hypothetical protein